MKCLLPCVAVATGLMTFAASGATKPVAQWSFDDPSNLGKDSIGDNDLIACIATESYGTPKTIADGHFGAACDLKRSATIGNAFRSVTGNLPTGTTPFTFSAWVRPDGESAKTAYLALHQPVTGGKPGGWSGSKWEGWYLRFADTGKLAVCFGGWKDGKTATHAEVLQMTVPTTAHNDGQWHHVVVTRDADKKVRLFWDGTKSAEKTITTSVNATSALRIGSYEAGNRFSGDYDEVKMWNVSLTDEEILREYEAKGAETVVADTATSDAGRVYGAISGSGTLTFGGVSYQELLGPLTFGGTYKAYSSIVELGYLGDAQAVPATAKLDLACTGGFNVNGDTTVAGLSGEGLCGAVSVARGKTLSVTDANDAALVGGLAGAGTVAKTGAGTLTLKGETSVANVAVDAGTLVAEKGLPLYAKGLVGCWRFEDAAALGRNLASGGAFVEYPTGGATTAQVADGKRGKGVSLRKGTTVANALLTPGGTVPGGQNSFTVAAWIRPASNSPKTAYILVNRTVSGGKPGSWTDAQWNGWNMRFIENGTMLSVDYQNGWRNHVDDAQSLRGAIPATAYNDGNWHHVALTREVTEETPGTSTITRFFSKLYFDGVQVAEKELTVNQSVATDARLMIGGQDSGNSFSGDYDEVMAFKQCLSAEDIAMLAQAKPLPETRLIDEATAHWTFDELVTEGDQQLFKDTGAANLGCDFLNTANDSGQFVECVTGEGINGGAAFVKAQGSYLQLADGSKAGSNLVQYGWPTFTLSIRVKNATQAGLGRNVAMCFGNGKRAETCLRLCYEGTTFNPGTPPQIVRVIAGNSTENGTSGVALDDTTSSASVDAPWTIYTFVNVQSTKKVDEETVGAGLMKVYRDGLLVKEISTAGTQKEANKTSFDFDLSRIDLGYNNINKYSGFMYDDLCVFRKRALSAAEVKRLVLEQSGKTGAPLADAAVSVANGATLKVGAGDYALKSLAGKGAVTVDPHATLAVGDWTGFTGTLSGTGAVVVSGPLPADQKVGTAIVAASGVLTFTTKPGPGKHVIAKAGAFELPADFSGWKVVVNGVDFPSDKYTFKVIGDAFVCAIKGGMSILVR